jgi:hypothetical protein
VRARQGDQIVLTTYGRSSGFCIDPVEKKALNHFLPGTPVLSFGTSGCNLGCKFCQNWDISKAGEHARAIAIKNAMRYVFTGNIHDPPGQATYCHNCQATIATHAAHPAPECSSPRQAGGDRSACQCR